MPQIIPRSNLEDTRVTGSVMHLRTMTGVSTGVNRVLPSRVEMGIGPESSWSCCSPVRPEAAKQRSDPDVLAYLLANHSAANFTKDII